MRSKWFKKRETVFYKHVIGFHFPNIQGLALLYLDVKITVPVRELMGRVRNVILMNVYLDLGNPGGSGFWVEGYMSQVREMEKLVYEQPGTRWTDPVTSRRVPSK